MKIKIELDFSLAYLEQYQALAKRTGRSLENLMQEALGQYIGLNSPSSSVQKPELDHLTQQLTNLQTRLKLLEQKQQNFVPSSTEEEEWEDEPDEVLDNFLPKVF